MCASCYQFAFWHPDCSIKPIKPSPYHIVGTETPKPPVRPAQLKTRHSRARNKAGFALAEVLIAASVLIFAVVASTQSLLQSNRNAAASRVLNAAKAEALSRIQQVSQSSYAPEASPPVIPAILATGTTTQTIDLGSESTDLGKIPGTVTWTVASVSGTPGLLSIRCTVNYEYLRKNLSYELFTYKSAD
jgi:type II secretory pathway pseudopilin PulG